MEKKSPEFRFPEVSNPEQGRTGSQDFSKGGHTVSNIIVMAFSPWNIVGCLLKKGLQRGGHGHPRTPPRYALAEYHKSGNTFILLEVVFYH